MMEATGSVACGTPDGVRGSDFVCYSEGVRWANCEAGASSRGRAGFFAHVSLRPRHGHAGHPRPRRPHVCQAPRAPRHCNDNSASFPGSSQEPPVAHAHTPPLLLQPLPHPQACSIGQTAAAWEWLLVSKLEAGVRRAPPVIAARRGAALPDVLG